MGICAWNMRKHYNTGETTLALFWMLLVHTQRKSYKHKINIQTEMICVSHQGEICGAMYRLKGTKVSGSNGILSEMVKNCGPDIYNG